MRRKVVIAVAPVKYLGSQMPVGCRNPQSAGSPTLSLEERCVSLNDPRVEVASLNMGSRARDLVEAIGLEPMTAEEARQTFGI